MEIKDLQRHIRALVMLEETESPVLSCYLDLEKSEAGYREALDERWRLLRQSLTGKAVRDLEDVFARIETFLKTELRPRAKGAAMFGRGGCCLSRGLTPYPQIKLTPFNFSSFQVCS